MPNILKNLMLNIKDSLRFKSLPNIRIYIFCLQSHAPGINKKMGGVQKREFSSNKACSLSQSNFYLFLKNYEIDDANIRFSSLFF